MIPAPGRCANDNAVRLDPPLPAAAMPGVRPAWQEDENDPDPLWDSLARHPFLGTLWLLAMIGVFLMLRGLARLAGRRI